MGVKALYGYPKRAAVGVLAALLLGLGVVGACNTVWAISRGRPLATLWGAESPVQVLLASAPYLALAAGGVVARRPWFVGLALTCAFWGFYLFEITRPYEGGGANIGLGILMLFSPSPIFVGSVIAALTLRRR
jgi:hypothetical protein